MSEQEKEPEGLSDEEMEKLKDDIADLFKTINWEELAEDEEEDEED